MPTPVGCTEAHVYVKCPTQCLASSQCPINDSCDHDKD